MLGSENASCFYVIGAYFVGFLSWGGLESMSELCRTLARSWTPAALASPPIGIRREALNLDFLDSLGRCEI